MTESQQRRSLWQRYFNPYAGCQDPALLTPEELRRREDLSITGSFLCLALILGLVAVALRFFLPAITQLINGQGFHVTGQTFISLVWALAWFSCAFILGFLFGIPKTQSRQVPSATNSQSGSLPSQVGETGGAGTASPLKVNTNLEEVSDWLTKILLGAGLTQLTKIPVMFGKAADFMSQGCSQGCSNSDRVFAGGIIMFFSALGFFAGYIWTRMYFAGAFARLDPEAGNRQALASLAKSPTPTGEHPESEESLQESAERSLSIPLSDKISATTASALAKGALLVGDTYRAIQAARIAISKTPNDPRVALDYAVALNKADASTSIVIAQIDKVRAAIPPNLDPRLKEQLYNSMIYLCLYQDPPDGFQKAIRLGQEFLGSDNSISSASIYLNLAAAYGQLYAHLHAGGKVTDSAVPASLEAARDQAVEMIKRALRLDPTTQQRLVELTAKDAVMDDDLAILAENEPMVRSLLGLPPQP
jgi:tetratricopeptide (TPR) repeat protein